MQNVGAVAGGQGFSRALFLCNRQSRQTRKEGKVGGKFVNYMTEKRKNTKN